VVNNKGSAGVDGMSVRRLESYKDENREKLATSILARKYVPQAILGIEIPKDSGKFRLLGVPTVVDRWLQQAVGRQLATKFELEFEEQSYGFRPKRNIHKAVQQSLTYINDGYQDIVDIDLKSFFDEVAHYKLLQLIYNKVKCPTTLWLIRKWLRAPILIEGKLHKRRKRTSCLVMGQQEGRGRKPSESIAIQYFVGLTGWGRLVKGLKAKGLRFVRYADDFSIYTKSKAEAKKIGNEVYLFLKDKLDLPINREMHEHSVRRGRT
jgi:retron-type reverse transcriptase